MKRRNQLHYEQRAHAERVRSRFRWAREHGMSAADATNYANGRPSISPQEFVDLVIAEGQKRGFDPVMVQPDDLSKIHGLGRSTVYKLHRIGIVKFAQIAEWDLPTAREFDDLLGVKGRVLRNDWVGQARALRDNNGLRNSD